MPRWPVSLPTRSDEPQRARDRILAVASDLFYREGVRAVGIDAIVERSGVAKMSLYRNFPSKDDLVVAFLESRDAVFWARWERAVALHDGDPRAQLEALIDMVADRVRDPQYRGCPFLNTATEFPDADHKANAIIRDHKGAVRARLGELAQEAGAPDPDLLADQLQLLFDGAYAAGLALGAAGPAETIRSAGRVLIGAQLGARQ